MEDHKAVEENLTLTPTESKQDGNVPCDLEDTSELSLVQEDTDRPAISCSSSRRQETQNLPSCAETGEISEKSNRTWHEPRSHAPSNSESSDESSAGMEVITAETSTSVSKGTFRIPPEVKSNVIPVTIVSEEEAGVDEVVVEIPKIQLTVDASMGTDVNYWTFSKNLTSRTVSATSEDTLPDHGVYVSEESSISSLDVSHTISNLKIEESVDSGVTLPLVESPPPPSKRKRSDSDLSDEDRSGHASKKIRILPEEVSSESTQMTDDEQLQETSVASASSEAVSTETDKVPIIEIPEDLEGCSKSEQGSTKRTMILRGVEDITDSSSDAKRIKPSD